VLAESTVSHPDLESWRPQLAQALEVWSLGQQQDLRPRLQAITCPVLWITGARDEKFTALAAGACPLLPRGVHLTVPDAGHRVHLDQPETVIREVRAFLQTTGC
jgi:2-succinyl-6-hydroxy-2,4-cyclohexadiene-1-carboxylate synthase